MKHIPKILLCTSALFMLGCSSSSEDQPLSDTDGTNSQLTAEVLALYPAFRVADSRSLCESSPENPLVGCYVSEVCANNGAASRLFVADFGSDGIIRSAFYMYQNSPSCSGSVTPVTLSALDSEFEVGEEIQSQSGVMVHELDDTKVLVIGGSTFTSNYFSSYYLQNNRLCLPDADYNWTSNSGGLMFVEEVQANRSTDIDFDNCLIRIK